MVRKVIVNGNNYNDYFVMDRDDGLIRDYLDKTINIIEKCYSKGRWHMAHIRYQLADGVSNTEFVECLHSIFPNFEKDNKIHDGMRCIWVREIGNTKLEAINGEEGGQEIHDLAHYHMLIFINRDKYKKFLPEQLHKLRAPYFLPKHEINKKKSRRKVKYLQHFFCPVVDFNRTNPGLWDSVDVNNLCATSVELKLNSVDAVRYAVYWGSYLAKVETKYKNDNGKLSKLVPSGRAFGCSRISKNWKEEETQWQVKEKIAELSRKNTKGTSSEFYFVSKIQLNQKSGVQDMRLFGIEIQKIKEIDDYINDADEFLAIDRDLKSSMRVPRINWN